MVDGQNPELTELQEAARQKKQQQDRIIDQEDRDYRKREQDKRDLVRAIETGVNRGIWKFAITSALFWFALYYFWYYYKQ